MPETIKNKIKPLPTEFSSYRADLTQYINKYVRIYAIISTIRTTHREP